MRTKIYDLCRRYCLLPMLLLMLLVCHAAAGQQRPISVSGLVADNQGKPVVGAVVRQADSNNAIASDANGNFTLNNLLPSGRLEVSSIGYKTITVAYSGTNRITVIMQESVYNVEEVVVVGYGSQKKVNMSGAVEVVSDEVFENRPVANFSRGLQGVIPNLNIRSYDGNPSRGVEFNVRGATSIGSGGSALVLIDGVEGDPNMLNPNDVESVSVLKDASSAAIYGSRGTFGVILITTKNPERDNRAKVTYSSNYTINKRTIEPELVTDGYTWAKMFNQSHFGWYNANPTSINSNLPFNQQYLQELEKRHDDPSLPKYDINPANGRYVYYDSHDWMKDLYRDSNSGLEHNITVSKASDRTSFYLSGRMFDQEGIYSYNNDDYDMYNLRMKGSARLYDWLEVFDNVELSQMDYREPLYYGGFGFSSEISMGWSMRAFPVSPMLNPDGTITEAGARSLGDLYYGKNHADTRRNVLRNTFGFSADLIDKILVLKGDYTFSRTFNHKERFYSAVPYSNIPGQTRWLGDSRIFDQRRETNYNSVNIYANSAFGLGDHRFNVVAGFNGESYSMDYFEISRDKLIFPDNPGFTLATGSNYDPRQDLSEWATMGFFARVNYEYQNRYLVELNGRYDGSSKFPSTSGWGFFPSVSAAWRISEEPFWNVPSNIVSQLKLRGSWGSLGNGNIAPYSYLEAMPVSLSDRIVNGAYPTITQKPSVIPDGLTWEVVTTANAGVDLGMLDNRLLASFDIYRRTTSDMFTVGPTLPDVFGAAIPKGNYADMKTDGWELSLEWRDRIGEVKPFSYGVKAVLADNRSTITRYYNPNKLLTDYYEGMELGEIWGFVTEGLFRDQADIDSHVPQGIYHSNNTAEMRPGDIKFENLNGDEIIDTGRNTADDPGDRRIIGNSSPRYTFGVNINMEWNNFALSAFVQGVGKRDWYPSPESFYFWGQYNRPYSPIPQQMLGNIYDENPEKVNPDAYFPRYAGLNANSASGLLRQPQTRYLQNAAYARLKNATLSYTLPQNVSHRAHMDKVTVYFTGQNLFTFSKLSKYAGNIDPETIESINPDTGTKSFGEGNGYPMLKSYTIGLNITF